MATSNCQDPNPSGSTDPSDSCMSELALAEVNYMMSKGEINTLVATEGVFTTATDGRGGSYIPPYEEYASPSLALDPLTFAVQLPSWLRQQT